MGEQTAMSTSQYAIKEIWRYPVKSMQGERLQTSVLTPSGVHLDRGWAIRDEKTQTIVGAKKIARLLDCSATYIEGTNAGTVPHVEITLPDGTSVRSDDSGIHKNLSKALDQEVTLWPLQPAEDKEHYRTKVAPEDPLADLRATFALEPDEPLPDLSGWPADVLAEVMEFATPLGTYFDAFPLDILTEASIRHLQALVPDAILDVQRFRPNILLSDSAGLTGLSETEWLGKQLTLGETKIDAVIDCPRCIMTTRAQNPAEAEHALPRDAAIMRAMVAHTKQNLSIYCNVTEPGQIKIGDTLSIS
jgi:MOSC domain-containing protein